MDEMDSLGSGTTRWLFDSFKCALHPFPSGVTCGNFRRGDKVFACGLFVPAKRCAGWGSPFDEQVKCSDLLRYLRYFVAVQAARETLTNSGKGLWPAETRSG